MGMLSFTAFRARRRLTLNIRDWNPYDSGRMVVEKGTNLTRDKALLQHLGNRYGDVVDIDGGRQHFDRAAPIAKWPDLKNFRGRVLMASPAWAIGNAAMVLCALAALKDAGPDLELGIAFVRDAHPLYQWEPGLRVHPYVLHEDDMKQYQGLVDLFHVEEWREQVYKPFDIEARLLEAFDVPASRRIPGIGRPPRDPKNPVIRLFPLASNPVRTLPAAATREIAHAVAQFGDVEIVLNPHQVETEPYVAAIGTELPANVRVVTNVKRLRDLIRKVADTDYGIFADSGPCHIAKLYDVMGFAVFTTVAGATRVGRFRNIAVWQTDYRGQHCQAPCGLAMLLATPEGRRGCWETLGPDQGGYRRSRGVGNAEEYLAFTFERPVPCVAALRDQAAALAQTVAADLETRLVRGGAAPSGAEGVG